MTSLNAKPNSSTKRQHQVLVTAGRRKGFDLAEIRRMVGGSLCGLSAAEASKWIEQFTGRPLSNPPGCKPPPYKGKPTPGITRMISDDQCQQIVRLATCYFDGDEGAARAWLQKNFGGADPRKVQPAATAKRGGEIIAVLKGMIKRRRNRAVRDRVTACPR